MPRAIGSYPPLNPPSNADDKWQGLARKFSIFTEYKCIYHGVLEMQTLQPNMNQFNAVQTLIFYSYHVRFNISYQLRLLPTWPLSEQNYRSVYYLHHLYHRTLHVRSYSDLTTVIALSCGPG
jgi:hypothetical protein